MQYNFLEVEKKWSNYWLNNKIYKKMNDNFRPRFFCSLKYLNPNKKNIDISEYKMLLMADSISRYKRMQGYNVLYSLGFNSFNKDAEDYALKTGNSPFDFSKRNINKLVDQFMNLGISADYELLVNSANKDFYKWSQWLFTKLYEKGLTEQKNDEVYYCDVLRKRLSEKDIYYKDGFKTLNENYKVEKKTIKNWYVKLDSYNDRLLDSLDNANYSEEIKEEIREVIGKKEGYNLKLRVDGTNLFFNSFTSRVDNLFGATFCLISPKNKYVYDITNADEYYDVKEYINNNLDNKELTGVFTGSFIINPINGKRLPIWVSNYFTGEYEDGFKICVPSCDILDYEFANTYGLDIIKIIDDEVIPNTFDGIHINSDFINGLDIKEGNKKVISYLIENGYGEIITTYKLKDICVSKPLFFGEPFPLTYMDDQTIKMLNSTELPLELPNITVRESFNELSPLSNAKEWLNVYYDGGRHGLRDTNTMNNYQSLSWFYLAFVLKSNAGIMAINSPDAKYELNKWLPLNTYLTDESNPIDIIYQKYMMYVLGDLDYVKETEPYDTLIHIDKNEQSLNIDEILKKYGSDVFRLFILNASDNVDLIDLDVFRRYIDRLIRIFEIELTLDKEGNSYITLAKEVTDCYENNEYDLVIKMIGEKINEILKTKSLSKKEATILLKLLSPIIPFVTEELYSEYITKKNMLSFEEWPITK